MNPEKTGKEGSDEIECKMANQLGTVMATAKAEIELPKK